MTSASGKLMQEIYDQFLSCTVCYETYTRPKTLSCLHVFCADCLQRHHEAEMERYNRYLLYSRCLSCPICRKRTELPTGGVRRLPDNFQVANLISTLTKRRQATQAPVCGICLPLGQLSPESRSRQAVSRCLECSKMLCPSCVEMHRRTRVTRTHSIIDLNDEKSVQCRVHGDEVVRFYCEPCEVCICVICTFVEHKGHDVSSLTEGMLKYRDSLDDLMASCQKRVELLRNRLEVITKCEGAIKQAEDRIKDTAFSSVSAIRKCEKQMLADLQQAYGEETLDYIKKKSSIQEALDHLITTCNLTDVMLKDKGLELLLLKKDIQEKIESLAHVVEVDPPVNIGRSIEFRPGPMVFGSLRFSDSGALVNHDEEDDIQKSEKCCASESLPPEKKLSSRGHPLHCFFHDVAEYSDACQSPMRTLSMETSTNTPLPHFTDTTSMTEPPSNCHAHAQTQCHPTTDACTEMCVAPLLDVSTSTYQVQSCDRSTLTKLQAGHDKVTDTEGLIICHHKCEGHCVSSAHAYSATVDMDLCNKATVTDPPSCSNKMVNTTRVQLVTTGSGAYTPVCLDIAVGGCVPGKDKATLTKAVILSTTCVGDGNVGTVDVATTCGSEGMFNIVMEDQGTSTNLPEFASQSTSMDELCMDDKCVSAELKPESCEVGVCVNPTLQSIYTQTHCEKEHVDVQTDLTQDEGNIDYIVIPPVQSQGTSMCSRVSTNDFGTMNEPKQYESQCTNTFTVEMLDECSGLDFVWCYDACSNTATRETSDVTCATDQGELVDSYSNTDMKEIREITTNTECVYSNDIATEMPHLAMTNRATNTRTREFVEKWTDTGIIQCDAGMTTATVPHSSIAVETESNILVDACNGSDVRECCDSCCMTDIVAYQEQATDMGITMQTKQMMTLNPVMNNASTDPISGQLTDSSCSAVCSTIDSSTEMPPPMWRDSATDTDISYSSAISGPDFISFSHCGTQSQIESRDASVFNHPVTSDHSMNTDTISACDRETGDIFNHRMATGQITHRASSPTHSAMVDRECSSREIDDDTEHLVTSGTNTPSIDLCDSFTEMVQVSFEDRGSSTIKTHTIQKGVLTDNILKANKLTGMCDVSKSWRDLTSTNTHQKTFMARGTCTSPPLMVEHESSPIRHLSPVTERSTSPIRRRTYEKTTQVSKADLTAPVEKFPTSGIRLSLGGEDEEQYTPSLTSINEDSTELSSASSDEMAKSGDSAKAEVNYFEESWVATSVSKPGALKESQFSPVGSPSSSTIICKVETGTSTPPVTMEDKSISTQTNDTQVVNTKMAACISKLRTLSQRLENHSQLPQSPICASVTTLPAFPDKTMTGHDLSSSTRQSTLGAETTVTTVHNSSRSAVKGSQPRSPPLGLKSANPLFQANTSCKGPRSPPAFFSPQSARRAPESSAFWSPGQVHKARSRKFDVHQLLNSPTESTTHEEEHQATSCSPFANGGNSSKSGSKELKTKEKPKKMLKKRDYKGAEETGAKKGGDEKKHVEERKTDTHQRHKSGPSPGSTSPFSSPERLKERLQNVAPAFDTPLRKARGRIVVPRSKLDKDKPTDGMRELVKPSQSPGVTKRNTFVERVANLGKKLCSPKLVRKKLSDTTEPENSFTSTPTPNASPRATPKTVTPEMAIRTSFSSAMAPLDTDSNDSDDGDPERRESLV